MTAPNPLIDGMMRVARLAAAAQCANAPEGPAPSAQVAPSPGAFPPFGPSQQAPRSNPCHLARSLPAETDRNRPCPSRKSYLLTDLHEGQQATVVPSQNFIHVRNLMISDPKVPGIIKLSQANEALRRETGYHTCPLGADVVRRVVPSRPIGTLSWLRTGRSRRRGTIKRTLSDDQR